jgi:DNA-binding transcriptional MocR family regulator
MTRNGRIAGTSPECAADQIERVLTAGGATDALPTVDELAIDLGISVSACARGLRLLVRTGSVVVRPDGILATGPLFGQYGQATPAVPSDVRDLSSGNPDPDLLPDLPLDSSSVHRLYGEPRVIEALSVTASAHLTREGVREGPVILLPGGLEAIDRIFATVLEPGDPVIVEDPTYNGDLPLLGALGLRPRPVHVDAYGFDPEEFAAACAGARACLVRPRAQNPTGAALDEERASVLRDIVAAHPDLLVVEEDHAGPVAGPPYHSMIPPDHPRWLHVASVSKWLGPDLRFAFVTGTARLTHRVDLRRLLGGGWVSRRLQATVSAAISDPGALAVIAKARDQYAGRRQALQDALRGHGARTRSRSGLNVWVVVDDEQKIVRGLRERGWLVAPGREFGAPREQAIRITIGNLQMADAEDFARDFDAARRD